MSIRHGQRFLVYLQFNIVYLRFNSLGFPVYLCLLSFIQDKKSRREKTMKTRIGKRKQFTFKKASVAMVAFSATLLIATIVGVAYIIKNIRQSPMNPNSHGEHSDVTYA